METTPDCHREENLITATHWGIARPVFKNGRFTGLMPFEEDPRPSPALSYAAKVPFSDARIKNPCVRRGFLENGPGTGSERGKEEFVEVSWETALSLAAKEIQRVYRDFGPASVYGRSYGWKSPGTLHSANGLLRRLLNLCGGCIGTVNSYSSAAISTILPYVTGFSDPPVDVWDQILENSQRVVFWGADPMVTDNIDWSTTLHNAYPYLEALRNSSSIKTIAINPLRTQTGMYLGSEWIAPKPGTDCALMLGLISTLEEQGLVNRSFIEKYVSGWDTFEQYLNGEEDGTPKSPEWAESVTGIPADKIRSLAVELASSRTMLVMGWGMQRRPGGEQFPWMGYALACALGQIGLPGGGIGTRYHYCQGGCPAAVGPEPFGLSSRVPPVLPFNKKGGDPVTIPVAAFADCFLNPGKTISHNGRQITYPEVKLVFWAGGNPFSHQPDINFLKKAWQRPETVIVADHSWSPTAKHADIVFPVSTVYERNDITAIGTYTNDGLAAMKKIIDPLYSAKSDFELFSLLAAELGIEKEFNGGMSEEEHIRAIYEDCRARGKSQNVELPGFEEFWQKGYFLYPVPESVKKFTAYKDFRADPEKFPLNTESGKLQIFSPKVASFNYADCPGHPVFIEDPDMAERSADALALMSTKHPLRLHSQIDSVLDKEEALETAYIHPEEGRKRSLLEGQKVVVENKYGSLVVRIRFSPAVSKGVLSLYHGSSYKGSDLEGEDEGGASNVLTPNRPTSSLACGNVASGGFVTLKAKL